MRFQLDCLVTEMCVSLNTEVRVYIKIGLCSVVHCEMLERERVSEYIGDVKEVKWRRQKGERAKSEVGVYPLYTHRLVGR